MSDFNLKVGAKVDTSTIEKQLNAKEYKVTATIATKGDTEYEKTVRKLKDANGGLYETTELLNKSTGETTTKLTKATSTVKETSTAIQTASKHTKTLGQDFLSTAGKVAKLGAITSIIGLFTKSMYEAVESVKEMDASLTELKKVSDLSGAGLDSYTKEAFGMARDLSTTASNVTDATTQFVQAGYDLGESQGLSKYAIMLQTIADETMDVETATNFLTSTMKAFNLSASDSEHIISAVNEVSNQYAITSNDLTENIGKVAGVAGSAGISFEELTGLMVSSVEKTRNASKSANAFKSIFINLQQMNESGTMPKLSEQFKEFGIEMTDASGATKNAFDLLNELATAYQRVSASTDVEKQNKMKSLLEDIGGKHNYNVLISSLTGFQTAIDATSTALNSANSAQIEFDKAMDSIAKRAEGTKGAFQELVWGNGGLAEFLKTLLSGTTSILKFMTDTKALNVILIEMGIILAINVLPNLVKTASSILMMAKTAIPNAISAWRAYSAGVVSANTAMSASIPVIGLIMVGITALTMAWNGYNTAQEEGARVRKQATDEAMDSIDAINLAMESLKDEALTREALNGVVDSNLSKYSEEISKIDDLNLARAKTIELLQDEKLAKAESLISTGMSDFLSAKDRMSDVNQKQYGTFDTADGTFTVSGGSSAEYVENLKAFKEQLQETDAIANESAIGEMESEIAKYGEQVADDTKTIEEMNEALRIHGKVFVDATETTAGAVRDMTDAEKEEYQAKQDGINTAEEYANAIGATTEEFEAQAEALGMTSDEYAEYLNNQKNAKTEAELLTENLEEANDAFDDSISQIGAISDSYSQLSSAVDEYNSSGALSFETLEKLMSLGGDYLSMLSMENGQLVLNKDGFDAVANAKIDDAEAMAYNSAMAQLDALALDQAGNSASTATPKFNGAGISAYNSGVNALNAVGNWQAYWKSVLNEKGVANSPATLKIGNNLKSQLTMLESARKSIGKYTTATNGSAKANGGATKATKDNTDAIKKQKEALEKLKSNYERAINYIKKKLDEDIDKLEEDKDKALESVDAKIDALNKQRDAEEKYWDDKIDALDEQNDALQTQIELEQKLEAVAKAKSSKVMIYKDGRWQYGQDESAVSSAEQDLYDFQENLKREKQVKDLEAMKDKVLANLDAQIDGWEAYKDNLEKNYDSQIDYLKKYKKNFENMVNSYSDAQDKLLAEQLTGINFEKGNWDTRLGNLQTFIAQYNSILSQLDTFDDSALGGGGGSSGGGGGGSSSSSGTQKATKPYTVFQILGSYSTSGQASSDIGRLNGDGMMSYGGKYVVYKKTSKQYTTSGEASSSISKLATPSKYGYKQFASGVSSIDADQMAIVGDDPNKNQELVAGSKASGKLMNLAKGTRVIDNGNTKLLGGLLNTFSKSGFIDSTANMTTANTNNVSNNNGMTINGGITIMANNPSEFENYFKRYNSNMLQKQFAT